MLEGAADAFLEVVTERAFDEPLLALLRAEGFEREGESLDETELRLMEEQVLNLMEEQDRGDHS